MKFHLLLLGTAMVAAPISFPSLTTRVERETCRLERSGKATGPSADICERLGARWTELAGTQPNPGAIELVDRLGYHAIQSGDSWTLLSPLPDRKLDASAYRKRDGLLRYYADNIIPHEAGHSMFSAYSGVLRSGATPNQYGTQAPDWLDEGVAVWMESASMREKRMRPIRGTTPSLAALVTMAHPGSEVVRNNALAADFRFTTRTVLPPCAKCTWLADSLRKKFQITDVGLHADGRPDTITWYADSRPTKSETFEEREFYPLSYALLRFIRIRGGAGAMRELVTRYQINPKPRVEVLSALPGLPASVAAVEKAWHAFLASLPAETE